AGRDFRRRHGEWSRSHDRRNTYCLVVGARRSLRIFSAFVDWRGLDVLGVSIAAALRRNVSVSLGYAVAGDKHSAVARFVDKMNEAGGGNPLTATGIGHGRPFPHVKL